MSKRIAFSYLLAQMLLVLIPVAPLFGQQATTGLLKAYEVGSGDVIRITVFCHADLSGTFTVDGSGIVAFPLVGNVRVGGLNTSQLQRKIVDRLEPDYIKQPRVSVEVINYRPFYIIGEVNKPGSYPYVSSMTVINAIALAGGYTNRARGNRLLIIRERDQERLKIPANPGTLVMPGDVIEIPERIF